MNPTARDFMEKAEADRATAGRELAVTVNPNFDAVCFHAQQAAEKMMKAVLIERGAGFPKTHDLNVLAGLLSSCGAAWSPDPRDFNTLAPAAVDYRYPGMSAGAEDAREAVAAADRLLALLRPMLRIPPRPPG